MTKERKPQVFDFATLTQAKQGLQKSEHIFCMMGEFSLGWTYPDQNKY
jgi:hypothetical protein